MKIGSVRVKRSVFCLWLPLLGFLGTMACLVCGVQNSCKYSGLEDTRLYILLLVFLPVMICGLFVAARESRRSGKGEGIGRRVGAP